MDPLTAAWIVIACCVLLILADMPVGIAIGLSGTVGVVLMGGIGLASDALAAVPYTSTAKYTLVTIPCYVLLGSLVANSGIGYRIYRIVNRVVRRLPGGLAATAVLSTGVFSGISGSSSADVAAFGRVSVSEMARHGYSTGYAAAVVAAAGTFAVLIPPSVSIVLYAVIAEQSVGAMILGAVVPGVASCLILSLFVIVRAARSRRTAEPIDATPQAPADGTSERGGSHDRPAAAGVSASPSTAIATNTSTARPIPTAAPADSPSPTLEQEAVSWARDGWALVAAFILFAVVVGGLNTGLMTATEAGAVGALIAMLIAFAAAAGRPVTYVRVLWSSLTEAAEITGMIFLLLLGGGVFAFAMALSGLPVTVAEWASGLALPPWAVLAIILAALIPLGAFLDALSVLLLVVPIIAPIAEEFGFSGVWFGILVLKVVEIGLITPPVGLNAFVISGVARVPVSSVYRQLLPFVILDIGVTAVFFAFPEIVLWLPTAAGLL